MSAEIAFHVPGTPVAKGRPRAVRQGGKTRHYTPSKTRQYEDTVAQLAVIAMKGQKRFTGPVRLDMVAYMPVPASWPKYKREQALTGALQPTGKPDLDNLVKAAKDAMNEIVWDDDAQVVDMELSKRYSPEPGLAIIVREAAYDG